MDPQPLALNLSVVCVYNAEGVKGQPLWDRVWSKVTFPDDLDHCWIWHGALSQKRRGDRRPVIQVAGRGSKIALVARLVCEWYQGPPPSDEHEAGHTCPDGENNLCVNPRHLRWMTRSENEQVKERRVCHGQPRENGMFVRRRRRTHPLDIEPTGGLSSES